MFVVDFICVSALVATTGGSTNSPFIIVLIAVGVLLFYLWNALTPSQKEHLSGSGASRTPQGAQFTEEELGYRNLVIYTCRGVSEPRTPYELARELQASPGREAEIANIVVDAICVGDEPFALKIFVSLRAVDQKDRAAKQVATFYIQKKRFADANRWAAFLSNSQDKEWWIRRILEASQRKG